MSFYLSITDYTLAKKNEVAVDRRSTDSVSSLGSTDTMVIVKRVSFRPSQAKRIVKQLISVEDDDVEDVLIEQAIRADSEIISREIIR